MLAKMRKFGLEQWLMGAAVVEAASNWGVCLPSLLLPLRDLAPKVAA